MWKHSERMWELKRDICIGINEYISECIAQIQRDIKTYKEVEGYIRIYKDI